MYVYIYMYLHVSTCTPIYLHVHVYTPVGMGVFGGFIAPAQPVTVTGMWFLNKGPCPVYCSGHGRHYVGNDVVDESH